MAFAAREASSGTPHNTGTSLRIKPDYSEAHYNLGSGPGANGQPIEAMPTFWEQALKSLWPDYPEAEKQARLGGWRCLAPNEGGDPVRALSLAKSAASLPTIVRQRIWTLSLPLMQRRANFPRPSAPLRAPSNWRFSAKQTETVGQDTRLALNCIGMACRTAGLLPPVGNQGRRPYESERRSSSQMTELPQRMRTIMICYAWPWPLWPSTGQLAHFSS